MASKKAKELSRAVPEPAQARAPGLWDARILPFLEQRALLIALCCMAVGCLRIAATWSELGLTFDEPQHFACGLEYLAKHVYRYETAASAAGARHDRGAAFSQRSASLGKSGSRK